MHDNALMIRICLFFTIVSSSILGDFNGWIFPLPSLHLTHPYKAVGQIIMLDDQGMSHSCSGVLISSQDVLTAAHCIIMPGTSTPYSSISFHPARFVRSVDRVAGDPQGSSLATDYWVFRSFLKAQEMGSNVKVDVHEFDIALFRLKDRLGDRMGWIDLFDAAAESILESQAFSSWTATLVGYPSSLLGAGVMATCRANESGLYDPLAAHSCQTAAGLSGSPLLSYQQD